jgi:hypothetical protein
MLILCRMISEHRYEALTKSPKAFASGTARTRPWQQQSHSYSVQESSSLHISFQQDHRMFPFTTYCRRPPRYPSNQSRVPRRLLPPHRHGNYMQHCLRRRRTYRLLSLQRLVRGLAYDTCGIETEAGDERDTQQKRNQTARTRPVQLLLIRSDDMEVDRSALGCCIVVEY